MIDNYDLICRPGRGVEWKVGMPSSRSAWEGTREGGEVGVRNKRCGWTGLLGRECDGSGQVTGPLEVG